LLQQKSKHPSGVFKFINVLRFSKKVKPDHEHEYGKRLGSTVDEPPKTHMLSPDALLVRAHEKEHQPSFFHRKRKSTFFRYIEDKFKGKTSETEDNKRTSATAGTDTSNVPSTSLQVQSGGLLPVDRETERRPSIFQKKRVPSIFH